MLHLTLLCIAILPPIEAISAAVSNRFPTYRGLEFNYTAHIELGKDGKSETTPTGVRLIAPATDEVVNSLHTIDVLRLWTSPNPADNRTRRVWIQAAASRKDKDAEVPSNAVENSKLLQFAAFDGSTTRLFSVKEGIWAEGHIVPYDDTEVFEKNGFDCILHLNAFGQPQFSDPLPNPYQWQVVGTSDWSGVVVYSIEGSLDISPYRINTMVTEPPHSIVVSSILTDKASGKVIEQYLIAEIDSYEGVRYPAKGSYRREPTGAAGSRRYDFVVNSVKQLDVTMPDELIPDFPPGTAVQDQTLSTTFTIPHEGGYDAAEAALIRGDNGTQMPKRYWFIWLNILLLLIAACFIWYRVRLRKASS